MNTQTQVATRSNNPAVVFQSELTQRAEQFKAALPAHITPEKFQRTILTAVTSDPDLLTADRRSLLTACMKAAQDGLLPDKREAALVIFTTNQKDAQGRWHKLKLVQYMPMVYGLRKKMLQSGEISSLSTNVVYRREAGEGRFIYEEGTEAMLRHRPMIEMSEEECSDANIVAAYSVAVMKDGTKSFEVMRRGEIDKVREKSQTGATRDKKGQPRTPSGPWVEWFSEMARKTVLRRHSKTLPMSGDLIDIEQRDDDIYARSVQGALASGHEEQPQAIPSRSEDAARLAHQPDDAPRDFDSRRDERQAIPREEEDEETARMLDTRQAYGDDGFDPATGEITDTTEGPADSDRGEVTTLDSAKDEIARAEIIADVNTRMAALLPLLSDDDADELKSFAMERIAEMRGGK